MGLRSLVFTSTRKVQVGGGMGGHEILSRALREADSVCHSWTQTVSECWSVGHQHLEGAASSRLDMKGWSRGKWLSNSRC